MSEKSLFLDADDVLTKTGALDQARAVRDLVTAARDVLDYEHVPSRQSLSRLREVLDKAMRCEPAVVPEETL
jgi:hypothetical protein